MKVLHIVRSLTEQRPLAVARRQAAAHQVTVLLLHDAVYRTDLAGLNALACQADAAARGLAGRLPQADDSAILDLIAAHDRVISW